jgi:hypothetical protein
MFQSLNYLICNPPGISGMMKGTFLAEIVSALGLAQFVMPKLYASECNGGKI